MDTQLRVYAPFKPKGSGHANRLIGGAPATRTTSATSGDTRLRDRERIGQRSSTARREGDREALFASHGATGGPRQAVRSDLRTLRATRRSIRATTTTA